jgi:hypothetical protein
VPGRPWRPKEGLSNASYFALGFMTLQPQKSRIFRVQPAIPAHWPPAMAQIPTNMRFP